LSRAYLNTTGESDYDQIDDYDVLSVMPISEGKLEELKCATKDDKVLNQLYQTIQQGWPAVQSRVREEIRPYFPFRDELIIDRGRTHPQGSKACGT
jgi:hypothetical protein